LTLRMAGAPEHPRMTGLILDSKNTTLLVS